MLKKLADTTPKKLLLLPAIPIAAAVATVLLAPPLPAPRTAPTHVVEAPRHHREVPASPDHPTPPPCGPACAPVA